MNDVSLAGIPRPGDVLVGKYRVERLLGVGGMGAVVSATHLQLEEKVAIKFLHAEAAQNGEQVARFLREGKAVIKIRSEHAVKVHDVGRLDSGAPYLVMEHLEGSDLDRLLAQKGPMPPGDVVDMILQGCEAIAEAHTLGIVHRDLKPANLFLTHRPDGTPCVKVLDFGISKATAASQNVVVTRTQAVMGSPRYMSPEQMRSTRTVDARTDIWSLGVVLYELLSGTPPFDGQSMTDLCAQILQDTPAALAKISPRVPPGLDAVVQRCIAKNPDERFANLAEMALAIAPFGSPAGRASAETVARLMHVRAQAAAIVPVATVSSSIDRAPSSSRRDAPAAPVRTDTNAVAAASQRPAQAGSTKAKVAALAAAVVVTIAGIGGGAALLAHRAPASPPVPPVTSTPPTPTTEAPAAIPTATPAPTAAPSAILTATPTATPTPTPPAIATSTPKPQPQPQPPPRKHAPAPSPSSPPPASGAGLFDGRK